MCMQPLEPTPFLWSRNSRRVESNKERDTDTHKHMLLHSIQVQDYGLLTCDIAVLHLLHERVCVIVMQ
jgi:hypothetical protein